jgi:hypothetical protein
LAIFGGDKVPDTTQASAGIGAVLTNPDNVDKLDKITNGISTAIVIGSEIKNNPEGLKEMFSKEGAQDAFKEMIAVKYKNSKGGGGFFNFIRNTQDILMSILNTAGDRIDMWRTTLPNLHAWKKSTIKMWDNTKKVYREFKWSDLWDIDRKWSRKMERTNVGWIKQYYGFLNYLWSLGNVDAQKRWKHFEYYTYRWQLDSMKITDMNLDKLKTIKTIIDDEEFEAMDMLTDEGKAYLFRRLPLEEMETAITALVNVSDVLEGDLYSDGDTQSKEDLIYDLQQRVFDDNNTYLKTMTLLATIKRHRTDIEAQITTLRQIQSNMATNYARVQMMELEEEMVAQAYHTNHIKRIVLGVEINSNNDSWLANRPTEY